MPKMDPRLALLLKANPDRTPSEMTQVLYGKKTQDITLQPAQSLGDLFNPFAKVTKALKKAGK